jgi:UDP-2-acetamido-2-deoxy-ribo-hexuluronate aminotransferase
VSIQFIDLQAQFKALEGDIRAGIDRVLAHGKFIMGPEIGELESELAAFAGVGKAVSCASGTDALLLPLMAWDIGPGDAVFVPTFTFIATAEVVSLLGATPVFVDIDERTFNLDPAKLREAVERTAGSGELRPRAVITVDLFGQLCDYEAIDAIAREHDLKILEDAAQAFGARHGNRRAGSFGHAAATSFFPAKPLGAYGDGGAVLTDDPELAAVCDSLRVHGKGTDKYDNVRIGLNARLDTLQAAILLPKLRALPGELEARQRVAERYDAGLSGVVETPYVAPGHRSAWAQYSVLSDDRDALQARLKAAGVPTAVYYPKPLHLQTAFADLGYRSGDFPVSESAAGMILSLPMHPYVEAEVQDRIVAAVRG